MNAKAILLDIEGTTSSISFVYDVLFPFIRRELVSFLSANWDNGDVIKARDQIAKDAGAGSFNAWCATDPVHKPLDKVCAEVYRLMDADIKATGLKDLQGLVSRQGYLSGVLKSHVYPDVPEAMKRWNSAGIDLRIYSSGSVMAQRMFFKHTVAGDLTGFLKGYYDTTTGPKRSVSSYTSIVVNMCQAPGDVLFISDVTAELDAARQAGLRTVLSVRQGNAAAAPGHGHTAVTDFTSL